MTFAFLLQPPFMLSPLKKSWLEALKHGVARVDRAGVIKQLRVNGQTIEGAAGNSLFDELIQQNPEWSSLLNRAVIPADYPLQLPFQNSLYGLKQGILMDCLTSEDDFCITLIPTLGEPKPEAQMEVNEMVQNPEMLGAFFREFRTVQSRLDHFMRNFPGIYYSQKPDMSFQYISERFTEWVGDPVEDFYRSSSNFLDLIFPDDRKHFLQKLHHDMDGESQILKYRIGPLGNGKCIFVQDSRKAVYTASGLLIGYEGLWLDITSQAMAEDRLITSSWKENVSLITSGLAHDFRNIISGIFSLAELVSDMAGEESPYRESLLHIKDYSHRALKLVHRIVELNRSEPGTEDIHNLQVLIREQEEIMRAYLPRNVKLELESAEMEIPVYLDKVEFERAMLNLAINARDALQEDRGQLQLGCRRVDRGELIFTDSHGGPREAPEPGAVLSFSDNGQGIHAAVIDRIFEAFFTTKESHQGSGLGLYSVMRFMRQSRGLIDLKSEEGVGTTFYLFFPEYDFRAEEALEAVEQDTFLESSQTEPPSPQSRIRIAVFGSDDLENLDLVTILRQREIEVICFKNADQLLSFLEQKETSPDAVIHHCPFEKQEEKALLQTVKERFPDVPWLLNTADKTGIHTNSPLESVADFTIKPSQNPVDKVRDILRFLR